MQRDRKLDTKIVAIAGEERVWLHADALVHIADSAVARLPEECSEEVGETARIAERVLAGLPRVHVLETARARRPCASAPRELLPLGADRVVALALLRIGEDLVRLVD